MLPQARWRIASICLWLIVAVLSLNLIRLGLARTADDNGFDLGNSAPEAVTPYYVELRSYRLRGERRHIANTIQAMRSDGSSVLRFEMLRDGTSKPAVRREILLRSGEVLLTDDVTERVARRKQPFDLSRLRDPRSHCLRDFGGRVLMTGELGRTIEVLGQKAIEVRTTAGEMTLTNLYGPNLGCATLGYSSTGYTTEATIVLTGEPPDELFAVSPHYLQVSAEFLRARRDR